MGKLELKAMAIAGWLLKKWIRNGFAKGYQSYKLFDKYWLIR